MNKWYRLGKAFAEKYTNKELYEFLRNNNYTNALGCIGKDFKEKDYKKICQYVGIEEEVENKHYAYGEKKYYFMWGFDSNEQGGEKMQDLKNLQSLVGQELDLEKAMCSLVDRDDCVVVSKVLGYTSNFEGHGECELYEVGYDETDITYGIWVDSDNIVVEIK